MRFPRIVIENFMAIGKAEVNLADRGLVLVQGLNKDDTSAVSNGAGKSSTFEALCWALYGATARGDAGDTVVNDYSDKGKNCRVQVDILDGPDFWRVTRYRKHKTGKNSVTLHKVEATVTGTHEADCTKGTNDLTQQEINKILGCPHEVFSAAIYAGQNKMPELAALTDKKLKVLVEEAAGVTILEAAYEDARSRASLAKAQRDEQQIKIDRAVDRIGDIDGQIVNLESHQAVWGVNQKTKIDEISARARAFAADAKACESDLAAFDEGALRDEIAACDAKIAGVKGEQTQERNLSSAASVATSKHQADLREMERLKNEARRVKKELDDIRHKVGCPCDSCARPLTEDEIAPAKEAITTRLRKIATDLRAATDAADVSGEALSASQSALDDHRASMTDLTGVSAQRANADARLRNVANLKAQRQRLIDSAKREIDLAKEKLAEKNPYGAQIEELKTKRATGAHTLAHHEKTLEGLNTDLEVAESVVKVFSPAGVRAHILDTVTPFLNDQTARYLSILSDGNISATWTTLTRNAKGELKEKFQIEVANDCGGKSYTLISGGEQRKVSIAAALALQDLVASRATKPIDLFVGDEIDTALDPAGVERLMTVFEEKARERGSVFVISHSDLKMWISQTMTVTKSGKVSTIMEEVS